MKTKTMILPMVCCIPILGSCTSLQTSSNETWGVNPVYSINQKTESPDALYQLGRYYQGQKRYEQATVAYLRALAADRTFVEAHNGLGVIYAMQGRYEEATTAFRTAISLAPTAGHLYNNLGYVQYLQGANTEAVATLEQAAALDPQNSRTLSNLSLANAKIDDEEETEPTDIVTAATSKQDTPPLEPAVMAQAQLPVQPQEVPAATAKSRLETVQLAPNVYELRERVAPAQIATAQASPQSVAKPANAAPLRLEISNGNGITGFAKTVSSFLGDQGYPTARLTNQKPFQVTVSQIQYRPGYRDEAQRIKSSLPGKVELELVQTNQLRTDIQARLLLGKDISRNVAQFEPVKPKTQVALNEAGADIDRASIR